MSQHLISASPHPHVFVPVRPRKGPDQRMCHSKSPLTLSSCFSPKVKPSCSLFSFGVPWEVPVPAPPLLNSTRIRLLFSAPSQPPSSRPFWSLCSPCGSLQHLRPSRGWQLHLHGHTHMALFTSCRAGFGVSLLAETPGLRAVPGVPLCPAPTAWVQPFLGCFPPHSVKSLKVVGKGSFCPE